MKTASASKVAGSAGGVEAFAGEAVTRLRIDLSRFFSLLLLGFVFAIVRFCVYLEVVLMRKSDCVGR